MQNLNKLTLASLAIAIGAGCGTPANSNDGGGADAARDTRVIENPGEEVGDPLPEMEDPGGTNMGTDMIGSCTGYASTLMVGPEGSRVCIDYNDGTAADAMMHCMGLGSGGTFNAGMGCNTMSSQLVTSCTQASPSRTAFFYRQTATRTMPDPVDVTRDGVSMWCSANMWTPTVPTTPTNSGRCTFHSTSSFIDISTPAVSVCVNYDSGFNTMDAQTSCANQTDSRSGRMPVFNAGESCTAGASTPGCRYTMNGQTYSIRISWPYRSMEPWNAVGFESLCEASGGTFFTGR